MQWFKHIVRKKTGQRGYTLTELSISTTIIAMLAVGALSIMQKKNEADRLKETAEKMERIESAIKGYIRANRRIPCPAPPRLAESNTLFGQPMAYNTTLKSCNGDADNNGVGDADYNGDGSTNSLDVAVYSTGAVPVRALNLSDDYAYDGWDRKFTYRISDSAGATADFDLDSFRGDLAVVDRRGVHKTSINEVAPYNNGAIYVIISHGSNGRLVAYPKNSSTVPQQATGLEGANTNHSSKTYVQAEISANYDDITVFGMKKTVIPPKNIAPPYTFDALTCENAHSIVSAGRSDPGLTNLSSSTLADHIFATAQEISYLCSNSPTLAKIPGNMTNLKAWYDAADPHTLFENTDCVTSPEPSATSVVACWKDKSGNGNNATNTASGERPVTGVRAINSKNALDFTGNRGLETANIDFTGTAGISVFFVMQNDPSSLGDGQYSTILELSSNATSFSDSWWIGLQHLSANTENGLGAFLVGNSGAHINGHHEYYISPTIVRVELNKSDATTEVRLYKGGTELSDDASATGSLNNNNSNNFGNRPLFIGARNTAAGFFDGALAEIAVYDRLLSTNESVGVENYLSDKWDIPLSSGVSLCPTGQVFLKDNQHPEGTCQCPEGKVFFQELVSESACMLGSSILFNGCINTSEAVPTYDNPPTSTAQTLWLDAADCSTIKVQGTAHRVKEWQDKSSRKLHVTQTTDANRPTYIPNTQNGLAVIDFDGNDRLFRAGVTGTNFVSNEELTIFLLQRYDSGNASTINWTATAATNLFNVNARWDNGAGAGYRLYWDFGSNTGTGRSEFNLATTGYNTHFDDLYKIITLNHTTSNESSVWINGTKAINQDTLTSNITATGTATLNIGSDGTNFLNGAIGEVIVYNSDIGGIARNDTNSYLADKWDVYYNDNENNASINPTPLSRENLELWLDALDGGTVFTQDTCTGGGGSKVGCWKDKSPNTFSAIQTTQILKPIHSHGIDPSVLYYQNNSAISFDGDDTLVIADDDDLDITGDMTLFSVVIVDDFSASRTILSKTTGAVATPYNWLVTAAGTPNFYRGDGSTSASVNGNSITAATKTILALKMAGTSVTHYKNGAENGTPAALSTTISAGATDLVIGGNNASSSPMNGSIGEIIMYSEAVSDIKRTEIENYLSLKWEIAIP